MKPQNGKIERVAPWAVVIFVAVAAFFLMFRHLMAPWEENAAPEQKSSVRLPTAKRLNDLLSPNESTLANSDIALLNLLCAQGLPGAEALNAESCLATIDQWAARVKSETDRHLYRFRSNPAEFEHSEGYFRMLIMAVVLYEDFGVRYNQARLTSPGEVNPDDGFFADSRAVFVHGLLSGRHTGTCSSMPVLYVAIGRRLGYPLKLVTTKAHLFLRWESETERFNLEATGKGMNRYDDDHFRQWPFSVTDEEIQADGFLKSLTPSEELAVFLCIRGQCFLENGQASDAVTAFTEAVRLAPDFRGHRFLLAHAQEKARVIGQATFANAKQTDLNAPKP